MTTVTKLMMTCDGEDGEGGGCDKVEEVRKAECLISSFSPVALGLPLSQILIVIISDTDGRI